jgi:hypothetical protein
LVVSTVDTADSLVDVVGLAIRAFSAEVIDEVEARLADTSADDPVLVYRAHWLAFSVAALATDLLVAANAVAALTLVVVDLSLEVTLRTYSFDQVIARKTSTGPNGGIPNFIVFASISAYPVDGVIVFSWRASPT